MANPSMVHTFVTTAIQPTMGLPQAPRSDPESSTLPETSNPKATVDGMSCVRQSLSHYQLPEPVAEVIMSSWRKSTQKQYRTYISKWLDFCHQGQIDQYKPSLSSALQFLQTLYDAELSYSSINTARSALSTFINIDGAESFGTHPIVARYLKGVFLSRKPVPKYHSVWDVGKVLQYFKTLVPNNRISLK